MTLVAAVSEVEISIPITSPHYGARVQSNDGVTRLGGQGLRDTVAHVGRQIDEFTTYTWYENVGSGDHASRSGYMDLTEVPLPEDIWVFTCGPLPFMRHVRNTLLARGVPAERIRYEVFGPDLWATQAPS